MAQKKLLCYIDSASETPQTAEATAVRLAKAGGAKVVFADVQPEDPWYTPYVDERISQFIGGAAKERQTAIDTEVERAREEGVDAEGKLLTGNAFLSLTREVISGKYDMLIKTAMGQRRLGSIFGSTAKRLLRKCPCPVLLTNPQQDGPHKHICVGIDPRPEGSSQNAINHTLIQRGIEMSKLEGAQLTLIHAWDVYGESGLASRMSVEELEEHVETVRKRTADLLNTLLEPYRQDLEDARFELIKGDPSEVMPVFVEREGVDMVLMGTIARPGIAGLLVGNTAEQIIPTIGCSLLALKPDGFRSPVQLED